MTIKTLMLIIIFNLIGCGGSTSKETTAPLKLPKMEMEIPEILIPTAKERRDIFLENEKASSKIRYTKEDDETPIVYRIAKQNTYYALRTFEGVNHTTILMDSVIEKVQKQCQETKEDQICTIEADSFEVELTSTLIDALIQNEEYGFYPTDIRTVEGKKAFLGKIEFIKYSESSEYDYLFRVEHTNLIRLMAPEYSDLIESVITEVKFNNNGTNIFSSQFEKYFDGFTYLNSLNYIKNQDGKEELRILINFLDHPDSFINRNTIITFIKDNDENGTFKIVDYILDSQVTDIVEFYKKHIYLLDFKNQGSFLIHYDEERLDNSLYSSKEHLILDNNGSITAIEECWSGIDCLPDDKSTWERYSNTEDAFNNFDIIYSRELNITKDEKLKDGEYFLLASEHNTSNLTISDVFNNKIAEVVIFQNTKQGYLYNKAYENKLNELQWVYANYNDNLDGLTKDKNPKSFTLVPKEDVPMLTLF